MLAFFALKLTAILAHTFPKENVALSAPDSQTMHQSDQSFKKITTSHPMKSPGKWILMDPVDKMDQVDEVENLVDQEILDHLDFLGHLVPLVILDRPGLNLIFSHSWNKSNNHKEEKKDLPLIHFLTCKHLLDPLDQEDHQACKVLLALRASKDPWENLAILDHLGLLDQAVHEVFQVFLEKMANQAEMEKEDPWDRLDLQGREDFLECLVYQDPRDTEVSQV